MYIQTLPSYVICGVTANTAYRRGASSAEYLRNLICFLLRTDEKTDVNGGNKAKWDKMTGENVLYNGTDCVRVRGCHPSKGAGGVVYVISHAYTKRGKSFLTSHRISIKKMG